MTRSERLLRLPRRFVVTSLCGLACMLLLPLPAVAQDGFAGLCPLFLQQGQMELEDLELAIQMEDTRLQVAEEIFVLMDGLYQNEIVERLPYLSVKNSRDVAAVGLELARRRVDRQQAAVEQYRLACSAPAEQERTSDERRTLEEAYERYLEADCEVRALDVTVFEVDLEYRQIILESSLDLRQNDIASRQDVLRAERDVQLTTQQLELARRRVARCRQ